MSHAFRYLRLFHAHLGWRIFLFFGFTLLATLAESFGILLLLPLLQGLDDDSSSPQLFGSFMDEMLAMVGVGGSKELLFVLVAAFFLLKGAMLFCALATNSRIVARLRQGLKVELLDRYGTMRYSYYVTKNTGHFVSVMNGQVNQTVSGFLSLMSVGSQLLNSAIYIGVALLVASRFALMALISGLVVMLFFRRLNARVRALSSDSAKEQTRLAKLQIQLMQGFKYLVATGQQGRVGEAVLASINRLTEMQIRSGFAESFAKVVREPILVVLVTIIVVVQIAWLEEPLGPILVSIALFHRALGAMLATQNAWLDVMGKSGAADAVCAEFDALEANCQPDGTEIAPPLSVGITLSNIRFRYTPDADDVLNDLNIHIPKNTSIALVGKSGAGKSTIADLLNLVLQPQAGSVIIDGIPGDRLRQTSWRKQIGYVSQDTVIFDDSIANNICMRLHIPWESARTFDRIREAARQAHISEFIDTLPQGYETIVGDRGVRLSGGQKQRLFIARELYRNPTLLILDEATSALDSESERMIQESIDALRGKLTIVIIAHRLSTIRNVDRVFVIQDGRVIEEGDFHELRGAEASHFGAMVISQAM